MSNFVSEYWVGIVAMIYAMSFLVIAKSAEFNPSNKD